MPEGRGKKTKKAKWQLVLGLKQVICGTLGLTWLMLIIFVLGVLAGRGDIYRWFSGWGLITPDAPRMAQWSPPPEPAPAAATAPTPATPAPVAQTQAKASQTPPAAPPAPSETITGTMVPTSSPASGSRAKKEKEKEKKGISQRDRDSKEKELQRLRQEVAAKLKFQNSFDTKPPKTARTAPKKKEKAAAAAAAPKAQAGPVKVAQFRDLKAAKAKMAELQKKGEKVALKQGKDKKGVVYNIVREAPANPQTADNALAQKSQKSGASKSKNPADTRN